MTAADILARMQVLDNELDVSSGGADETRALAAADMAQDYLELLLANFPNVQGTIDTITTALNTETTARPATLKRVDNLYLLDSNGRQGPQVDLIQTVGAHAPGSNWLWSASTPSGTGAPLKALLNSAHFYWSPLPDGVHTLRIYGLFSRTNLTTRAITFGYPDEASLPLASTAVRFLEMGIDDPSDELEAFANQSFRPLLKAWSRDVRQRSQSRAYRYAHTT